MTVRNNKKVTFCAKPRYSLSFAQFNIEGLYVRNDKTGLKSKLYGYVNMIVSRILRLNGGHVVYVSKYTELGLLRSQIR